MLPFPYRYLTSLLLCAVATTVSAATLLVRQSSPGYVPQELALSTTCVLDDKGVVTTKEQLGKMASKTNTSTQFSLTTIRQMIDEAATGKLKKPEFEIADAPSKTYYAFQKQADGKINKIFLYEDLGNVNNNKYNDSSAALSLKTFIDVVCD
jgi:hypothetical protein